MTNLFQPDVEVDFWVWVDPEDWLVRDQIEGTGGFTSGGLIQRKSNLMLIPNPEFSADMTPFQHGTVRGYLAEYNLEQGRLSSFDQYPSRLNAIYLFLSEEEAHRYRALHSRHVEGRKLKKCRSVSIDGHRTTYSVHDIGWVDFLRRTHSIDHGSIDAVGRGYWSGQLVRNSKLESLGMPWTQEPVMEVLFVGRIEFYERSI